MGKKTVREKDAVDLRMAEMKRRMAEPHGPQRKPQAPGHVGPQDPTPTYVAQDPMLEDMQKLFEEATEYGGLTELDKLVGDTIQSVAKMRQELQECEQLEEELRVTEKGRVAKLTAMIAELEDETVDRVNDAIDTERRAAFLQKEELIKIAKEGIQKVRDETKEKIKGITDKERELNVAIASAVDQLKRKKARLEGERKRQREEMGEVGGSIGVVVGRKGGSAGGISPETLFRKMKRRRIGLQGPREEWITRFAPGDIGYIPFVWGNGVVYEVPGGTGILTTGDVIRQKQHDDKKKRLMKTIMTLLPMSM
jgi:hypothetical protein